MCSDAAKQKVRQAALRAGITRRLDSDALVLLYEPEAAALHYLTCEGSGAGSGGGGSSGEVQEGEGLMVLDAGGGTVDVTLHRVAKRSSQFVLEEATFRIGNNITIIFCDSVLYRNNICPSSNNNSAPNLLFGESTAPPHKCFPVHLSFHNFANLYAGGCCGSTFVDDIRESYFEHAVGSAAYHSWRSSHPQEYAHLLSKWEAVKCEFDGINPSEQRFGVTPALRGYMADEQLASLRAAVRLRSEPLETDGRLAVVMSPSELRAMFDPVVDQVRQ